MNTKPDTVLFLDDHRGVYIPRDFASCVKRECVTGVRDEDWDVLLSGPENELYWDAWSDVCNKAVLTDPVSGVRYTVYQDGACWLIPVGMEWDEETETYQWPKPITLR